MWVFRCWILCRPFMELIWLLVKSMQQLPAYPVDTVYRGVKDIDHRNDPKYKQGITFTWHGLGPLFDIAFQRLPCREAFTAHLGEQVYVLAHALLVKVRFHNKARAPCQYLHRRNRDENAIQHQADAGSSESWGLNTADNGEDSVGFHVDWFMGHCPRMLLRTSPATRCFLLKTKFFCLPDALSWSRASCHRET